MAKKGESTRLETFGPDELAALAQFYPTIRRELHRMGELTQIRLPEVAEPERRLEILRDLDTKRDLYIRISYAGNLFVRVRAAPGIGEDDSYFSVFRRPVAEWCKPVGNYYPDKLVDEGDDDIPSEPVDNTARAQYRVAKIVAEEIPGVDAAIARRIAERVMEQLWRLLEAEDE